jgi:hypothetical protein
MMVEGKEMPQVEENPEEEEEELEPLDKEEALMMGIVH